MNCGDLFYKSDSDEDTLHDRLTLSDTVLAIGLAKKNELIGFLREELREAFDCDVKFLLQGSRQSRTLIKPVDKFSSYDLDVGVYLFFDAESEGVDPAEVKLVLKDALSSYCNINDECKIQDSKNACEGLIFSQFLTIDTPIYYKTDDCIRLATDKGWIDSDPKSIQNYLNNCFENPADRALMKRIVRYLKVWVNIHWQGTDHKKIPSLGLNLLVAHYLQKHKREDDTFIHTVIKICEELESYFVVNNPLDSGNVNIIAMSEEDQAFAHQKLDRLKEDCERCLKSEDAEKAFVFSNLFGHFFPQVSLEQEGKTGLPALSKTPVISMHKYDKDGNFIETCHGDEVTVRKGEILLFAISNKSSYNTHSVVQWTVRNIGKQATDANDIGHREYATIDDEIQRSTAYTGSHSMECVITENGIVTGAKTTCVKIKPRQLVKQKANTFKGFKRGRKK